MFFVPYDSPFVTFQDVLDHAQANPGKLKVATAGYGTLDDIAIRFFASKGYEMVNVPYAKPAERYAAAVGKHTDLLYEEPGDVDKFLSAKKLRSVVVFDTGRHPAFPDVPTARELGYLLEQPNWRGIVGPAGIAKDRAMVLNEALAKSVGSEDWHAFCNKTFTCATAKSPEESIEFVRQVYDDRRQIHRGIRAQEAIAGAVCTGLRASAAVRVTGSPLVPAGEGGRKPF